MHCTYLFFQRASGPRTRHSSRVVERRHWLSSVPKAFGIEVAMQRKLEAYPCPEGFREMFRAKSKEHEGIICKGHVPNAFGISLVPERVGAMDNLVPVYVGRVAGTPKSAALSNFHFKPLTKGRSNLLKS